MKTFSDEICDWLLELGYTHCFFVAGGNIMHLLNSARTRFTCIPVIHEVTAGIAAEYFNEIDLGQDSKAFALVTAGPGLTNIVTALAGAHMESRALLVIGGQVKSSDLSQNSVRQRGIQEIDGAGLVSSISKISVAISKPISKEEFIYIESQTRLGRKGVVFIEVCLDAQAYSKSSGHSSTNFSGGALKLPKALNSEISEVRAQMLAAERPIILVGGGISRKDFSKYFEKLTTLGIPLMTTWNGADRVPNSYELFWGRPNTWGMRYSNLLIQQADFILSLGTRLGLQQTGFNWQEFAPLAKVIQVDIDKKELNKGHPKLFRAIESDANYFLYKLIESFNGHRLSIDSWIEFGNRIKSALPLSEDSNNSFEGYWNPYDFIALISNELIGGDALIPSSSGATETVAMQAAVIPQGAIVVTNKGMASMGYGLAGAIGAAFKTKSRVFHIEGDGGFAQNLQELGTVRINNLPIKTFIFDNGGYASIKMTQKNYFLGQIVGCDANSGLGLPNWKDLFRAFNISCDTILPDSKFSEIIKKKFEDSQPRAFLIPIHPEQTYFPKISSRVLSDGSMVSNPLHLMSPELTPDQISLFLPFLRDRLVDDSISDVRGVK